MLHRHCHDEKSASDGSLDITTRKLSQATTEKSSGILNKGTVKLGAV
nr:hypothetical protein [Microcystis sp. 0824]